jgi:hypothetical protein
MKIWGTETIWLDLAVFLFVVLVSHILLGHFEDYKPKWRRILKVIIGMALFLAVLTAFGRVWGWLTFIVPIVVGGVVVHGWWLPKHGINGWTGEPRQKYLELVGARQSPVARGERD